MASHGFGATVEYPVYFVVSILEAMRWPRKKGFLRRKYVSGDAVRTAWTGMIQGAMALGAGRPMIACQILTRLMPWEDLADKSGDSILATLDPVAFTQSLPESLPWDALVATRAHVIPDSVPWHEFTAPSIGASLRRQCSLGLVFGLAHAKETTQALDRDREKYLSTSAQAIKYGLSIPASPPFPNNESYFRWLEQTVRQYEAGIGALPSAAPRLLASKVLSYRLK